MRSPPAGVRTVHASVVAVLAATVVATLAAQGPSRPFGLPNVPRESPPTAGMLLVASRTLSDPNFAETVIVLTEYSSAGAVGLVVNRRTDVALARVFPSLPSVVSASPNTVFQGGPVEVTTAQALRRGPARSRLGRLVADDLQVIGTPEALEAQMAESVHPDVFRVYLGYAGWSAKQLEGEVSLGAWHVFPADARIVFDPRPDTLWDRQIRRTEWRSAARQTTVHGPRFTVLGPWSSSRQARPTATRSSRSSWRPPMVRSTSVTGRSTPSCTGSNVPVSSTSAGRMTRLLSRTGATS